MARPSTRSSSTMRPARARPRCDAGGQRCRRPSTSCATAAAAMWLLLHVRARSVRPLGPCTTIRSCGNGWRTSATPADSGAAHPPAAPLADADQDGERPSAVQAACFLDIKRTYMELRPQLRRVYTTFCDESVANRLPEARFCVLPQCGVTFGAARITPRCSTSGRARWTGGCPGWRGTSSGSRRAISSTRRSPSEGRGPRRADPTRVPGLQFLTQRQGSAVSRDILRRQVWGHRGDGASNVVDAVIRSLRKKLGSRASTIETVSGVGYRFCPERMLATLLFVDIVRSTEQALALGDARWRALLDRFHGVARARSQSSAVAWCIPSATGSWRCSMHRRQRYARLAIRDAVAALGIARVRACIRANVRSSATASPASPSTSPCGSRRRRDQARFSPRPPCATSLLAPGCVW